MKIGLFSLTVSGLILQQRTVGILYNPWSMTEELACSFIIYIWNIVVFSLYMYIFVNICRLIYLQYYIFLEYLSVENKNHCCTCVQLEIKKKCFLEIYYISIHV